jgi:hypothetical protein
MMDSRNPRQEFTNRSFVACGAPADARFQNLEKYQFACWLQT